MNKCVFLIFMIIIGMGNFSFAQEAPRRPMPKPNPKFYSAQENEQLKLLVDWRDYPLAMGCERSESTDTMYLCTEEKMAEFISTEFTFPSILKDRKIEESVTIKYKVSRMSGIQDLQIVPKASPEIHEELVRVLNHLNANLFKIMHPQSGRYGLIRLRMEHIFEVSADGLILK